MECLQFGTMAALIGLMEIKFSLIGNKGGETLPSHDNGDKDFTCMIAKDGDCYGEGIVGMIVLTMGSVRCGGWFEIMHGVV